MTNLAIPEGTTFTLLGPKGAGKILSTTSECAAASISVGDVIPTADPAQ